MVKQAQNTDMRAAITMAVDEMHLALHEALHGLHAEVFWAYPLPERHNICTIAMHLLQQHDFINRVLSEKIDGKDYAPLIIHEERFHLWGLGEDKLPREGQDFPSPEYVIGAQERIHKALLENLHKASLEMLDSEVEGPCPTMLDLLFRGVYHGQAHVRQIWYLRGKMHNTGDDFPSQYYA